MNIEAYTIEIKTKLSELLHADMPVVDGPLEFAKNTQVAKNFVYVHDVMFDYEPHNTPLTYDLPSTFIIGVHAEKKPVGGNVHLREARHVLADLWRTLGSLKVGKHQVLRQSISRTLTDDPAAVAYEITITVRITEYESCK